MSVLNENENENETIASTQPNVTLEAVVIRADGSREDLGIIAASYNTPERQRAWRESMEARGAAAGLISHGA